MIGKTKLTLDIDSENKKTLENIKKHSSESYGSTINFLVSLCPKKGIIQKELYDFCVDKIKMLLRSNETAGGFQLMQNRKKIEAYMHLITILDAGITPDIQQLSNQPQMLEIPIKDGSVIYPDRWIVLNDEDAAKSITAGVVECRNSSKYGIPTFLFFTNLHASEYTEEFEHHIYDCIQKKWPKWSDILQKQVKIHYDKNRIPTNTDEYLSAPTIGFFELYSDTDLITDPEPPEGSYIRHNKGGI